MPLQNYLSKRFWTDEKLKTGIFFSLSTLWVAFSFSTALVEIAFWVAFGFYCLRGVLYRSIPFRDLFKDKCFLPLVAYGILCAISIFWSEAPAQSWKGFLKVFKQLLLLGMVMDSFSEKGKMRWFENVFLITVLLTVGNGLVQYFCGRDLIRGFLVSDSSAGVRITSSFKTYGLFAAYLMLTLPYFLMLGLRFRNQDHRPTAWYFSLLASLGGTSSLFLTRSRGALLAAVAGILIALFSLRKFKLLAVILVAFCGFLMTLPTSMIIHLDADRKEQSIIERFELWHRATDVIKARPLTGTGINTYALAHQKYDTRKNWRVKNYYAHNGYLQIAAEVGLPALLLLLAFLFLYFKQNLQGIGTLPNASDRGVLWGLLTGLFSFLLFASVDTILHNNQAVYVFWFLMGLPLAYQKSLQLPEAKG